MDKRRIVPIWLVTCCCIGQCLAEEERPDYDRDVAPILTKYCAGCHNASDREGELVLESYASLQQGIDGSPVLIPGDAQVSRLWRALSGQSDVKMPPEDEPAPGSEELERIKLWIDQGAAGPAGIEPDRLTLHVPKIEPQTDRSPITALAYSPDGKTLAIGRYGEVTLLLRDTPADRSSGEWTWTTAGCLTGIPGKVNAVQFFRNGEQLLTASGVTGSGGIATLWNWRTGERVRDFKGHRDALFDVEVSPDGTLLATCSYDRQIILWDLDTGEQIRTLAGHNGAVYDVAFSPDGTVLASASADDTCKLWRVADGERLDTLSQPLKEVYAIAFSRDVRQVVAGGGDNQIRIWQFLSRDKPKINPQLEARFAHEAAVVRLAFTPDGSKLVSLAEDRTIKVWETKGYTELKLVENQPEVAMAVAVSPDGTQFTVGRLDGTWETFPMPGDTGVVKHRDSADVAAGLITPHADASGEIDESEPNDVPQQAQQITVPATIRGVINGGPGQPDRDCFRFTARAHEEWAIEVHAARNGSPLDSFLEVLTPDGRAIEQALLQAVRESYFTFRGKNGDQTDDFRLFNWEEMELNELLYANGEVVKLWLYPRGPDSGFMVYPGSGTRWNYFGTSGLAHALGEPCYIVRPYPAGTKLVPNGLPAFHIYYENDDGSRRDTGPDSKLFFVAPHDGDFVIRLRDVRGDQGSDDSYALTVRPRRPDFEVQLANRNLSVDAGSGADVEFKVERKDEFDGPINIDVTNLPAGFRINTPVVIEDNQISAHAVLLADVAAASLTPEQLHDIQIVSTADIRGEAVAHAVAGFEELKLDEKPPLTVVVQPAEGGVQPLRGGGTEPLEFEIHPGETIMLKVVVDRRNFDEIVAFGKTDAGRNLPHGVYVDNIGLNGLMLLPDQYEREFFITAAKWVPEQTRMFHLRTIVAGNQASAPVVLHVRPAP